MHEMMKDKKFSMEVFSGETQFGRTLVDEKAAEDATDILPYEIVTNAVNEAKKLAVVLCYCRHKQEHLGQSCYAPLESCMAMNIGADFMIKQGYGREISKKEALEIIEKTSKMGLMHIGDNVKNNLSFICNCCECCCGILQSYHHHGIFPVAVTSSFTMKVDSEKCVGCGACVSKCQVKEIGRAHV